MSTSPQRSRNMASDITKLFRHVASQPRVEKDTPIPVTVQAQVSEVGTSKKKITRIPLFGRPRKKSTTSLSSSPYSSTGAVRQSTDVGEMSSRAPSPERDGRPSGSTLAAPKATLSKVPHSSFATKISARFAHPQKAGQSVLDARASSSRTSLLTTPSSTGLVPRDARPSYESASSTSSRRRSTTPRGTRPVITISRTDNLEEFRDLFTIEMPARPSLGIKQASGSGPESDATQSPHPRPVIQSLEPTYKRGQTPASVLAAAIRDQQSHQRQPSECSRNSQRTSDSNSSGNDRDDGRTTPMSSSAHEGSRSSQLPEMASSQSLPTRRPSVVDGSSVRARTKPSMVGKPPSIPLPALPSGPPPGIPSYTKTEGVIDLSETDSRAADAHKAFRRPRALTTSSIPEVPVSDALPVSQTTSESKPTLESPPVIDADEIDIDTASVQQLQTLLRKRNKQFEELTTFMLRKEETWASERKVLEKKICYLQRDVIRQKSEITGLKLIISDEDIVKQPKPLPAGILNQSRLSPISTTQSDQEGPSILKHTRRVNYQSDSGAESPRGSGTESTSSILRIKKMHQRSSALVGELTYASRSGTSVRNTKFPPSCSDKSPAESPYSKRMSIMSIASSASSSSSLMPPSPSITVSSLSAIPEGSSSVNASNSNEERRATRISRRISASSMTSSSSTAASSAYSNIKRSRPPSIAQVLEKSPNMDDILDKLRPFA